MIGDVSGKGVPASLFMAITKTLCQSLARRPGGEPGELLSALNQEISRDNPTAMFVTAIVGIIDSRSGEVAIANAGHNPPILLHDSTAPKVLGDAGGPPLGLVENFTYPTERLRLVQSARLVLLTDGVTEAENSNQEHYGIERAINCLRGAPDDAAALCQTLHADVKKFAADAARSDDLTLVAVALRPV
jgi:sigma-B regulation protein RsbU (phosphoserine phosphatase)